MSLLMGWVATCLSIPQSVSRGTRSARSPPMKGVTTGGGHLSGSPAAIQTCTLDWFRVRASSPWAAWGLFWGRTFQVPCCGRGPSEPPGFPGPALLAEPPEGLYASSAGVCSRGRTLPSPGVAPPGPAGWPREEPPPSQFPFSVPLSPVLTPLPCPGGTFRSQRGFPDPLRPAVHSRLPPSGVGPPPRV